MYDSSNTQLFMLQKPVSYISLKRQAKVTHCVNMFQPCNTIPDLIDQQCLGDLEIETALQISSSESYKRWIMYKCIGMLDLRTKTTWLWGWSLGTRVVIVNHKFQIMCYILQLDWSLLLLLEIHSSLSVAMIEHYAI